MASERTTARWSLLFRIISSICCASGPVCSAAWQRDGRQGRLEMLPFPGLVTRPAPSPRFLVRDPRDTHAVAVFTYLFTHLGTAGAQMCFACMDCCKFGDAIFNWYWEAVGKFLKLWHSAARWQQALCALNLLTFGNTCCRIFSQQGNMLVLILRDWKSLYQISCFWKTTGIFDFFFSSGLIWCDYLGCWRDQRTENSRRGAGKILLLGGILSLSLLTAQDREIWPYILIRIPNSQMRISIMSPQWIAVALSPQCERLSTRASVCMSMWRSADHFHWRRSHQRSYPSKWPNLAM